jgi:hypothetical protein
MELQTLLMGRANPLEVITNVTWYSNPLAVILLGPPDANNSSAYFNPLTCRAAFYTCTCNQPLQCCSCRVVFAEMCNVRGGSSARSSRTCPSVWSPCFSRDSQSLIYSQCPLRCHLHLSVQSESCCWFHTPLRCLIHDYSHTSCKTCKAVASSRELANLVKCCCFRHKRCSSSLTMPRQCFRICPVVL